MVRRFQDMYFNDRRQSTVIGYSRPNLLKIAKAYGLSEYAITAMKDAEATIERALSDNLPAFVDAKLEQTTCVDPKLVVSRPIEDRSPHLDREELKRIMLIDLTDEQDILK